MSGLCAREPRRGLNSVALRQTGTREKKPFVEGGRGHRDERKKTRDNGGRTVRAASGVRGKGPASWRLEIPKAFYQAGLAFKLTPYSFSLKARNGSGGVLDRNFEACCLWIPSSIVVSGVESDWFTHDTSAAASSRWRKASE